MSQLRGETSADAWNGQNPEMQGTYNSDGSYASERPTAAFVRSSRLSVGGNDASHSR